MDLSVNKLDVSLLVPQRDVRYPEPRNRNIKLINPTKVTSVPRQSIISPFLHCTDVKQYAYTW